ncbi:unnamed protein product [[Actinomadura] parvosata subsp. kistnae]|uniref:SdpI family protein n=1 Tax=[Actinomadura] parvosata subsp. kistnae TaxID=1909395 RepID=A0A1V0A9U1_9ACTN|nr:SdpI family protein [Nonomuraea sp. ATCC 55076]AQZ66965.1 hypothetical protein BKM31_40885 [Nonomuraea sp. ATCC 55076]SPL94869.1 unnamed protein product [Actinomadura parvosata subsp. kistnae]
MNALPIVLALAALILIVLGWLGRAERLPRNGLAGVRTPSTMRSDAAWRAANKAAGIPIMAAGVVALAGAAATWLMPPGEDVTTVVYVVIGCLLVLVVVGGVMGVRAAGRVPG